MNKILFWILLMAVAGILITMVLISLAPYIAGGIVLWLVFKPKRKTGTDIIDVTARTGSGLS